MRLYLRLGKRFVLESTRVINGGKDFSFEKQINKPKVETNKENIE